MQPNTYYENDLIEAPETGLATFDEKAFAAVSKVGDFLPRIQLYGGNSKACKTGHVPIGNYGIPRSEKDILDLGKEVDVIVISGRAKAMRITADDTVITKFDHTDVEFQKIAAESDIQDSGCMFGPEFLLYVPKVKQFVTFFMSSKSARRVSGGLFQRLKKAATLKSEFVEKGKFAWHAPVITPCSTPLDVPDSEEILAVATKFANEKGSAVKTTGTEERER